MNNVSRQSIAGFLGFGQVCLFGLGSPGRMGVFSSFFFQKISCFYFLIALKSF
jgi:hypothetical protein